jgi:site-specific DNA-methyltransferase (adenine-specific)
MSELYFGDCLKIMPRIASASVDMVLCDLPYGTTQNKWDAVIPLEPLWKEYNRICKLNGAMVFTAQTPFDKILGASNITNLKYEWIWEKGRATGHLNAKIQPMKAHENILVFYRNQCFFNPQRTPGKRYHVGGGASKLDNYGDFTTERENDGLLRYPRSIQNFKTEIGVHPTQKPVALVEYLIRTYTNEGDTVLDNTMGSGTTGVACANTGRNFIGIEQDENYFKIAQERIFQAEMVNL